MEDQSIRSWREPSGSQWKSLRVCPWEGAGWCNWTDGSGDGICICSCGGEKAGGREEGFAGDWDCEGVIEGPGDDGDRAAGGKVVNRAVAAGEVEEGAPHGRFR